MEKTMAVLGVEFLVAPELRQGFIFNDWRNYMKRQASEQIAQDIIEKNLLPLSWSPKNIFGQERYYGNVYVFEPGYRDFLRKKLRHYGVPEKDIPNELNEILHYGD